MAEQLHKYKYGGSALRPSRTTRHRTPEPDQQSPTPDKSSGMATEQLEANILSSLRGEISQIIREELKCALAEDYEAQSELRAVRSEMTNNTTAIRVEVECVKADIHEVKDGLWTWSEEVTSLQATVTSLQSQRRDGETLESSTQTKTLAPPQRSLKWLEKDYSRPGRKAWSLKSRACPPETSGETKGDYPQATLRWRCHRSWEEPRTGPLWRTTGTGSPYSPITPPVLPKLEPHSRTYGRRCVDEEGFATDSYIQPDSGSQERGSKAMDYVQKIVIPSTESGEWVYPYSLSLTVTVRTNSCE